MIEVMNWIAQDSQHFLGTLLFIYVVGAMLTHIIAAARGNNG